MNLRALHGLALGVMVFTAGCAARAVHVRSDYDPAANVGRYVTFFMIDGHSSGDARMDQEIKSGVETALADKGWVEAPVDEGEAIVIVHAATAARHSPDAMYAGWGGWDWRIAGTPTSGGLAEQYQPGSVVVDIFDARTRRAIWRGVATAVLTGPPATRTRLAADAIEKMFTTFPTAAVNDRGELLDFNDARRIDADRAPRLIFSTVPAVLVSIHGEPVYREIPGTRLTRIVNSRALIVRDAGGVHYLKVRDGWMEAYGLSDWWSVAGTGPEEADTVIAQAEDAIVVDVRGADVYVSTTPAELIVTDGDPRFMPVAGTSLLYVINTSAGVFKEPTDRELYVLASGRWLRAWTLAGPWQYVQDHQLPADFASIPGELLNRKASLKFQ